ncbi:MAG: hypothetical protein ACR2MQ_06710 [Gemmatimonadaceae bacterium]
MLEIRIGDAASAVLQAQRTSDAALVPGRAICELAELRCSGVTEEYITLDSAAAMLHAHVDLDWAQLTVLVTQCDSLPVVRRFARAEAHAALLAQKRPRPPPPDYVVRASRDWIPAVIVNYTMTAAASSIASATHALNLATAALGGAIAANIALAPAATTTGAQTGTLKPSLWPSLIGTSWLRAWSGAQLVRKLRLGDVSTTTTGMLRGASITNEPYAENGSDSVSVTGTTTPGLDTDAFRDGALLATTTASADGSYTVWLPAVQGYNNFTITSYDSFGQERHARRSIYVPPGMLPPRSLRYVLSAGRCLSSSCGVAADVGVSYALFDRLTTSVLLAGASAASASAFLSKTVGLVARVTDALSTSLSRTGSSATSASAHFAPNPTLDVFGTYHSARPTLTERSSSPLQHSADGAAPYHDAAISASWRPRLWTARVPWLQPDLTAHVSTIRSASGSATTARLAVAIPLPATYIAPFALYTQPGNIGAPSRHTIALGLDAIISPTHVPSLMAQSIIHLNAQTTSYTRPGNATATLSVPARGSLVLDAQASWSGGHTALLLKIRQWIGGFRATSVVNGSLTHAPSTSHTLDGSFVLDLHRRRVTADRAAMLGSARIAGVIFIDRNRNGVRDAGEAPVPGVYVRARDGGALSDSAGEYEIGDVEPFASIVLEVDLLTLPSPSLTPLHSRIRAAPVPSQILQLDIPIVDEAATAVGVTPTNSG